MFKQTRFNVIKLNTLEMYANCRLKEENVYEIRFYLFGGSSFKINSFECLNASILWGNIAILYLQRNVNNTNLNWMHISEDLPLMYVLLCCKCKHRIQKQCLQSSKKRRQTFLYHEVDTLWTYNNYLRTG